MSAELVHDSRLPEPGAGFRWETDHGTPVLRVQSGRADAVFTTRLGGVSPRPWRSLNLAFGLGDDDERVNHNRRVAGRILGTEQPWATLRQVHGRAVVRDAENGGGGVEADAIWSDTAGSVLAIQVADCVPVLGIGERAVVAAHAGWRGLADGVVEDACGSVDATRVYAGPAIGPCCFEVGPEVVECFTRRFGDDPIVDDRHVDIWTAVRCAAELAGVSDVQACRVCTSCHPELLFSHRRDNGATGRQALVVRLT